VKVSIVIPTLNEEKYIGKTLQCLVDQTFKDFEVIVCDGKSRDKTREKALEFKDKLDLTFLDSPKRGVSFQRNFGAEHAKCSHLIFFDADITIEPDFLQKVTASVEVNDPDLLTCWGKPDSRNLFDKIWSWIGRVVLFEGAKKFLPNVAGCFIFIKKQVFDSVGGFDERINFGEDFDLSHRVFRSGCRKFSLLKEPNVRFSVRKMEAEGRVVYALKFLKNGFLWIFLGPLESQDKVQDYWRVGEINVMGKKIKVKGLKEKIRKNIKKRMWVKE
jgi:glycosyltransferase involved in cell wall biosynthesis